MGGVIFSLKDCDTPTLPSLVEPGPGEEKAASASLSEGRVMSRSLVVSWNMGPGLCTFSALVPCLAVAARTVPVSSPETKNCKVILLLSPGAGLAQPSVQSSS